MLAEMFSAEDARKMGILNAVVPAAELENTAMAQAEELASKPPADIRATKALLRANTKKIADPIAAENKVLIEQFKSEELKEVVTAFFEKRPADFSKFD